MNGDSDKRRRGRSRVAGVVIASLVASLLPAGQAQAEPGRDGNHLSVQVEKLDSVGGEVRGKPWPYRPQPKVAAPEPVWPKPGVARAVLPAAPGAAAPGAKPAQAIQAGGLPVWVERAPATPDAALAEVSVELLDRGRVPADWRDGLVLRLNNVAGAAGGSPAVAKVTVGYNGFRYAYGGDWASRLRLWQLPDCALAGARDSDCVAKALPSANQTASGTVSAQVAVGEGTVVALSAGASGPEGDFTATPLSPSSTWSAGGSTGGFTWSYPLRVPPTIAGAQPGVTLAYSSSSVDGRSEATNNQPSVLGEGFEYSPGFIERRYVPCAEDMAGENNNTQRTGDLCWRSDNATLSLNGSGTELVYEAGKGWHARTEDGSRIEKLTGASGNGDDNGEHWKITSQDGVQYFFGLHSLPGHTAGTNSTSTVPVYGNHPNEPCHGTTFAASDCAQAWRWNLDYVIDLRGNTQSYWYARESNRYAARASATTLVSYVRSSTLTRIDYGTWDRGSTDRSVSPVAQVLFTPGDRCLSSCATHDATHWPDVPWDQECKADATSCDGKFSPTFWTTKRLAKVTTRVWDTTKPTPAWQEVESWTLTHSFPSPGDGNHAGLWLESIVHAGHINGTAASPPVTFEPTSLPNRVLTRHNTTNNWQRIANIITETGAKTHVDYSLPECTESNLPAAPQTNTMRCYPVIVIDPSDPFAKRLITEWWHTYVVTSVSESDLQLADGHQAPPKYTTYFYEGTPAWHYADDDGLTKPDRKTWSQFRGYATVTVRVGDVPGQQSLTKTRYLRGMHGDRLSPSGGTRTVTVPATMGTETVYDEDPFAGMIREQAVYNGTESRPVSKTVNVPWQSPATASRTINGDTVTARFVDTRTVYTATALGVDGARGWRIGRTRSDFDDRYGTMDRSHDDGDLSVSGDEQCVSYMYNRNTGKNLVTLPKRVTTTAVPCGTAPSDEDEIVTDVRTYYDGATSVDTLPVYGSATRTERLKDWTATAGTVWQTVSQATFDAFGRALTTTDIKGNTSTYAYTPASGGPVIRTTVTSPQPYSWVTTTDLAPYLGSPTKVTDPNGRVTDVTYDPFGRVSKVWKVGRNKADHPDSPSADYEYVVSPTRADYPYVKSRTVHAAGGYRTTFQIFDGFLRPRQSQTSAVGGGRVVTDTRYDKLGRADMTYSPHVEPGTPSGVLWWEPEWSVPALTKTVYDNADRTTATILYAGDDVTNLVEKWRTTIGHEGDLTKVTPPSGGTATTTVVDVFGRTAELRQHTTTAGVDGAYDTTTYSYNRKRQLTKVVDPSGNEWRYAFDIKGRQRETRDPDKGTTTLEYNDFDELTKTIDARGEVLVHTYDPLGRKTAVYDDSTAGFKRTEWRYDRLYTGQVVRGQLTEAIRYIGTDAYTWQVRGLNQRYQITGANYVIPAVESGLSGTYAFSYSFSPHDDSPTTVSYPAAGGLSAEQVTTEYEPGLGLPSALNTNLPGVGTYVVSQQYTAYGEPALTMRKTAGGLYVEDATSYDTATRRVIGMRIKPETAAGTVSDRTYSYDAVGNITSIAEAPQAGAADSQCFRYDRLRRLTSAWTPRSGAGCTPDPAVADLGGPASYWLDWSFDKTGNRRTQTSHSLAGDTTITYTVPAGGAGVVRPHAVTAVTTQAPNQAPVARTYGYDNAGNTTARPGPSGTDQTLTWDPESRLSTVVDGTATTTNVYDADGTRLIRRDATGTTLYLPGMEIRRANGTSTATRYYTFAGRGIASRTAAGGLHWLCTDHQGTQQTTVNALTQQVTIRRQNPYGEPRGAQPAWPNGKGFVGGDIDPTGLTHLGAREYDPGLGRFISVDPVMDLADPQQWNAYAYAHNSPVTSSDPTGLKDCADDDCNEYAVPKPGGGKRIVKPVKKKAPSGDTPSYCYRGANHMSASCNGRVGGPSRPAAIILGGNLITAPNDTALALAIGKAYTPICGNSVKYCETLAEANEDVVAEAVCRSHPDWCDGTHYNDPGLYLVPAILGAGYLAFGTGKPPHVAIVTIHDANGNIKFQRTLTSGNMTDKERALGFPRSSLATHTEARATRLPVLQEGDHMIIEGQYRPCPACKGKMNEAYRRGIRITYMWNGKVWRPNGGLPWSRRNGGPGACSCEIFD